MSTLAIAIAVSELVALFVAWQVLRTADPLWFRIANALVAFIPFIGPPLAYWTAAMPEPHHPAFRDNQRYSADVYDRWSGALAMTDKQKRKKRWKEVMEAAEREEQ